MSAVHAPAPRAVPFARLRAEADGADHRILTMAGLEAERRDVHTALRKLSRRQRRRGWLAGVRHAYGRGWAWGLVCGTCWGATVAGLFAWLGSRS